MPNPLFLLLALVLAFPPRSASAAPYQPSPPGSPATLTDWRWLARPLNGRQTVISDPLSKEKLAATDGGFAVLEVQGPGVLDHLWTTRSDAVLTIEVDGQPFWKGTLRDAIGNSEKAKPEEDPSLIPVPLIFWGGAMCHLVAPIGFSKSLRILSDKDVFPRYLSYRTFPPGTEVLPASADAKGQYASGLKNAAVGWRQATSAALPHPPSPQGQERVRDFVLQAKSKITAIDLPGSGEITQLEFHVNPALTGSLREVVVSFFYDGAKEPSLRLPLPDLVGVPHPWPEGRWNAYNGDLSSGIQYPWYVQTPRYYYPEVTYHLSLPIPFARGVRIEMQNRSESIRFAGFTRAIVEPLSERDALATGRLCALRAIAPVILSAEPQPLISIPGPGQLVGLGLFVTGNSVAYPPAVRSSIVSLTADGGKPITGPGLIPLWFQGAYGGPIIARPIWNHPRYEHNYGGVMRHFLTDPIALKEDAVFAFTPGTDENGAPKAATAIALWYRFADTPYAAPALPDHAEPLPHSTYSIAGDMRLGPGKNPSQLFWAMEAEDLAALATCHGGEARAVEDAEHNYHPSAGRYLQLVADQAGDYVDCVAPFPHFRYLALGTLALWGPNRGNYELDILSKEQAKSPPDFPQSGEFYTGRILGSVPMKAAIFTGGGLSYRRDASVEFPLPFLNPAPDEDGVLRFICQSKGLDSGMYQLVLDQIRLDIPPPTEEGWREFEEGMASNMEKGLMVDLPKFGRFSWSGWGAIHLASPRGGTATFHLAVFTGSANTSEMIVRGCLGPKEGTWQVQVTGTGKSVTLTPGKDEQEVQEWQIPIEGAYLPGEITIVLTCTAPGVPGPGMFAAPNAELDLDAWTVR